MNIHNAFALFLVLASLSFVAADRLTRQGAVSSIAERDAAVADTSRTAANTGEAAGIGGYWLAWTEAATH